MSAPPALVGLLDLDADAPAPGSLAAASPSSRAPSRLGRNESTLGSGGDEGEAAIPVATSAGDASPSDLAFPAERYDPADALVTICGRMTSSPRLASCAEVEEIPLRTLEVRLSADEPKGGEPAAASVALAGMPGSLNRLAELLSSPSTLFAPPPSSAVAGSESRRMRSRVLTCSGAGDASCASPLDEELNDLIRLASFPLTLSVPDHLPLSLVRPRGSSLNHRTTASNVTSTQS